MILATPPQSPSGPTGVSVLVQKIHMCVSQLEQLPVKVHDLPGRRGSHAMRFFNTHQIKCVLERHPSAVGGGQWKGGPLRIDPLATIQVGVISVCVHGWVVVMATDFVDTGAVHGGSWVRQTRREEGGGVRVSVCVGRVWVGID